MPKATLILINHQHDPIIRDTIESILHAIKKINYQFIIINNIPSFDSNFEKWVKSLSKDITLITNPNPFGFAKNVNQSISNLPTSQYYILVNPDITCHPNLFDILIEYMESHKDVAIAGPKLLNPDGSVQHSCRNFSTPFSIILRALRIDLFFPRIPALSNYLMLDFDHNSEKQVDWVTGALIIVRKDAIDEVGLMDADRYFLYSEDQDWCCRMWQAGWKISYVPNAVATHQHLRSGILLPFSKYSAHQFISAWKMFRKFNWHLTRNKQEKI